MTHSDPTPEPCPRCGSLPRVETYMANNRQIDALTSDLIEYEITEYACCGYVATSLDGWNSSEAADTIAQQAAEIERLQFELSETNMEYGRLIGACESLTGSLWPQNETTAKLRDIIGNLEKPQ